MFVLFGFGHKTFNEKQLRDVTHCYHCNNVTNWILSRQTNWFTLFFIPVIPFKTEYQVYCPICKKGHKITQNEFDQKSMNIWIEYLWWEKIPASFYFWLQQYLYKHKLIMANCIIHKLIQGWRSSRSVKQAKSEGKHVLIQVGGNW